MTDIACGINDLYRIKYLTFAAKVLQDEQRKLSKLLSDFNMMDSEFMASIKIKRLADISYYEGRVHSLQKLVNQINEGV